MESRNIFILGIRRIELFYALDDLCSSIVKFLAHTKSSLERGDVLPHVRKKVTVNFWLRMNIWWMRNLPLSKAERYPAQDASFAWTSSSSIAGAYLPRL